jgi:hypothetical protein
MFREAKLLYITTIVKTSNIVSKKVVSSYNKVDSSINEVGSNMKNGLKAIKLPKHILQSAKLGWTPTAEGNNPVLMKTENGDSLTMKISNYGTGEAFDISCTGLFVYIKGGILTIQTRPVAIGKTKQNIYYPGSNFGYEIHTDYKPCIIDSAFFCFKLDYSDSTKKRKTFTQILMLDKEGRFTDFEGTLYVKIEKFLLENKYWKAPFK